MKDLERIPGYYWVHLNLHDKWTIAEYDKDGHWWFIGNDGFEDLEKDDIIGESISREGNPIEIIKELIDAIRYTAPRSNALNNAYFKAKEFLGQIIKPN